ncbi:hypothetical protein [Shinella pollutisoli]|uniref:Uncharacterized protein n=1 Tax=Shinella pollutisoli TaxID=2250594 RepID=A0ABV7DB73_9HYPH|nr:hypothetical protein [Shinella pollutisoli]
MENHDPITQRIGNFSVCMDVIDGDLQIRVYPVGADGQTWDYPVDTFDVRAADCSLDGNGEPDDDRRAVKHFNDETGGAS